MITALLAVMAGTALFGQRTFRPMDASGTAPTPPDPATMVANRVAHLTTLLDLTTAQANQATSIFTVSATASTPILTTLQTLHLNLQAATKANVSATIDALSTQIGTAQGQLLDLNTKADAAFYAILSPTQQTKYDSLGHSGPGGHGGPGGPGGPGGQE